MSVAWARTGSWISLTTCGEYESNRKTQHRPCSLHAVAAFPSFFCCDARRIQSCCCELFVLLSTRILPTIHHALYSVRSCCFSERNTRRISHPGLAVTSPAVLKSPMSPPPSTVPRVAIFFRPCMTTSSTCGTPEQRSWQTPFPTAGSLHATSLRRSCAAGGRLKNTTGRTSGAGGHSLWLPTRRRSRSCTA